MLDGPWNHWSSRTAHPKQLAIPFAHTNSYFFPHTSSTLDNKCVLSASFMHNLSQDVSSGVARGAAKGASAPPLLMESLAMLYRSTYLLKLVTYQLHIYKRMATTVLVQWRSQFNKQQRYISNNGIIRIT